MPSEDFTSNIRGQETRDHTYPDYPQPSNLNEAIMQEDNGKRALSHDIHESNIYNLMTSVAQNNFKLQNFLELKKENELFRRKVKIIKRHFKNSQHPLRMLADLFAEELERIHKKSLRQESITDDQSTGKRNVSDREIESENFQ
jgi:hypothetical protein